MSKLTNRVIVIPPAVKIVITKEKVQAQGPQGTNELNINPVVEIIHNDNKITTQSPNLDLAGTFNSLIYNLIEGVNKGYKKILKVAGVGYKVALKEKKLEFSLGKSHLDYLDIPDDLEVQLKGNEITISGVDKSKVGGRNEKAIQENEKVEQETREETLELVKEKAAVLEFFFRDDLNMNVKTRVKVLEKVKEGFTGIGEGNVKKTVFKTRKERFKKMKKNLEENLTEEEELNSYLVGEVESIVVEKDYFVENQLGKLGELFGVEFLETGDRDFRDVIDTSRTERGVSQTKEEILEKISRLKQEQEESTKTSEITPSETENGLDKFFRFFSELDRREDEDFVS
ncbi:2075_t:CDS:2 [Paraglomus occultum]|uniref:2075_t:CDS:1 n=1 Tax=Paraglomus occultum TaxID=144539 RepID=A0A9N9CFR5_9GLOM|nr:2075_t:CDS:2 [Paraglomus occultum]